jgi:hypothetical protein
MALLQMLHTISRDSVSEYTNTQVCSGYGERKQTAMKFGNTQNLVSSEISNIIHENIHWQNLI